MMGNGDCDAVVVIIGGVRLFVPSTATGTRDGSVPVTVGIIVNSRFARSSIYR